MLSYALKSALLWHTAALHFMYNFFSRSQASPDTFDKRVARVNMETKVTQLHEYYVWRDVWLIIFRAQLLAEDKTTRSYFLSPTNVGLLMSLWDLWWQNWSDIKKAEVCIYLNILNAPLLGLSWKTKIYRTKDLGPSCFSIHPSFKEEVKLRKKSLTSSQKDSLLPDKISTLFFNPFIKPRVTTLFMCRAENLQHKTWREQKCA